MIDPSNVPAVALDELLARYVLYSKHIRASDQTVKPDAFIPHPHHELSVTRHLMATEQEIWNVGNDIALQLSRPLYGRADLVARECASQELQVLPRPVPGNPNHADIAGWPNEKSRQKMIAIEIANASTYLAR